MGEHELPPNTLLLFCIGCDTIVRSELFLNKKISKNIIDYINKIFTPNEKLSEMIDKHKRKKNLTEKYNIFHLRNGDKELVEGNYYDKNE